jgi:hypothetical protein
VIVTMDGLGDGTAVGVWKRENGRITLLMRYGRRGSLRWFYGNVTEALGWWHGDGEGKTMSLAPYEDPSRAKGVLDKFYPKFQGADLAIAVGCRSPGIPTAIAWLKHMITERLFGNDNGANQLINFPQDHASLWDHAHPPSRSGARDGQVDITAP